MLNLGPLPAHPDTARPRAVQAMKRFAWLITLLLKYTSRRTDANRILQLPNELLKLLREELCSVLQFYNAF